ncbi:MULTISPECIES: alpha/beta hydrolase family protein [unclassified Paenibacillus]|uniref:alpha/beta hydrolase n=1 Tax=unclassified Paenibacillus TaxID=185978 RepID=UPI00095581B5|nr:MULTISPECIES: alpha/beta hydrolase family protein [unclassified Paenibacillus]ASS68514.1 esterase family protein [Paenibacillus sp. RUD330]SIR35789.1 S-formylglutathione hydrolase FrmB [Paenibacillus sp. RU4X]SIR46474.1 S-formylglutathione hydrolase FrmB [Paenibacillus sp. RU4T]
MALIQCDFFSDVLGLSCSMNVILPQQTTRQIGMEGKAGEGGRYPVLYLLHGLSDDHSIWLRRTSIERYAAGLGIAVVMPAVQRGFYADMHRGGRYWTFVSEELPELASQFFPISRQREDSFAAGLSMGGYGAMKLGLARPDRFAAVASLSGAMDIRRRYDQDVTARQEIENIFGPEEQLPGSINDLFHLAEQTAALPAEQRPMLYQCCGTEDFLYEENVEFKEHALRLDLPLHYEEGPGEHEWGYWDAAIQRVLAWLPLRDEARS